MIVPARIASSTNNILQEVTKLANPGFRETARGSGSEDLLRGKAIMPSDIRSLILRAGLSFSKLPKKKNQAQD